MAYSQAAWTGSPLGRLQGILLRLQYVLRDPDAGGRLLSSIVTLSGTLLNPQMYGI
jgi:hypothetical protein